MKTTVAIVGLGSRGRVTYAPIAKQYPDLMEITALADINPACVEEAAKEYNVPKERCFTSAEELLAQPKLADAIFICTQDQDHVREALVALEKAVSGETTVAGKRLPYPDGEADFPQRRGL